MQMPQPRSRVHIILIAAALLGFLVLSHVLVARAYAGHVVRGMRLKNPHPYLDPARNFIPQEDFIVNVQPLRERLQSLSDQFGNDSVSVYVEYLNTGANISINPSHYMWPASLAKVPLAMAVLKKVEQGEWNMTDKLVLMEGDRNSESGDSEMPLDAYPIGTAFTIEELLEQLIVHSDNTAFYILQRNLHRDEIKRVVDELGLEALFSEDGKVSAKEYSRLFRALYTASFLTREYSEKLLALLDASTFDDFLAKELPPEVPFAHKYGEKITLNVYADSGIVYLENRPYLITVIVQGDEQAPFETERQRVAQFMHQVARETHEYFVSQRPHE